MVGKFWIDNKCSRDFGILTNFPTVFGSPSSDVEYISVPGRNGDLIIDNNRYANYELIYPCAIMGDITRKMHSIRAWLNASRNYRMLRDTYNPGYFRLAAFSSAIDVSQDNRLIANFDVTFNCKPWLYRDDGEIVVDIINDSGLYNPESFFAAPVLYVTLSSKTVTGNIYINNQTITIKNVDNITIDCDAQDAYYDGSNLNSAINTASIRLESGYNNISFDSTITSLKVKPRWRTI